MNRHRSPRSTVRAVARTAAAALVAGAACCGAAAAAVPQASLLYDLDSTSPASREQGSPAQLTPAGSRALFVVRRFAAPRTELWSTDGRSDGTRPLASLCASSYCEVRVLPPAGTVALFAAEGALWRCDGTPAGTFALVSSGFGTGAVAALEASRVLFGLGNDRQGELWQTDGSLAGTRRVAGVGMLYDATVAGGVAYFHGTRKGRRSLWRSDGTEQGTFPLHRIEVIQSMSAVGGRVLFIAGEYASALWLSDGTVAGTRRLIAVDGCSDHGGCGTRTLGVVGSDLYLAYSRKLWRADAVTGKVTALAEMSVGSAVVSGGRLYFSFYDRTRSYAVASIGADEPRPTPLSGCGDGCPTSTSQIPLASLPDGRVLAGVNATGDRIEVWAADASGGNAARLLEIEARGRRLGGLLTRPLGDRTLMSLSIEHGGELWVTDGTPAGTHRLAEIGSDAADLAVVGDRAFFGAYDAEAGFQLWSSDGTPAGTGRLLTLEAHGAGSRSRAFAALVEGVAFRACDGARTVLWASDGVPGRAPTPLLDEREGCEPLAGESTPLAVAGRIFFTEPDAPAGPGVRRLWTSDGTPGGTMPLTSFDEQLAGEPFVLAGKVSFVVQPLGAGGASLWETDGTAGGTVERLAFPAGLSDLRAVTPVGEQLYFAAVDAAAGLQLFATDPATGTTRCFTVDGPEPLDVTYGLSFYPPRFTRFGDYVYFAMCAPWPGPCGLFRTRGTAESTAMVIDDPSIAYEHELFVFRDRLLFVGRDGLASIDGTTGGIRPLAHVVPGALAVLGDRLYFLAQDEQHGREPWVSDGTTAGTHVLVELAPGAATSQPAELVAGGERLWLAAADTEHGRELWSIDPSTASASVVDIAPGAMSSSPSDLTRVGPRLLLTADDGDSGREPWVVPLPR